QAADLAEGQDPARARRDHARGQPGDHHGARRRRDRGPRRVGRARLPGRRRSAAQRVRARRDRLDRDPRPRHRPRPDNPGTCARAKGAGDMTSRNGRTHREHVKEEARMLHQHGARRVRWIVASALALAVLGALSAAGMATARSARSCGTVTLNEQAWAGSTANTYVAKYVLEHSLGCKVKITQIAEIPVYEALAHGKVDAVLEDWQHVDQYKQYGQKQKSVVIE